MKIIAFPLKLSFSIFGLKYVHAFTPDSVILNLSLGTVCYEYPSGNSSVPITVNCAIPENLCFKYDNTTANGEQVTIQGCTSADQCRQFKDQHLHCCEGHLCNGSKYDGHKKVKKLSIYVHLAMFLRNREKLDYFNEDP